MFGCVGSSLLHAGFLQLWRVGATLPCGAQILIAVASLVAEHGLQAHRLQQLWHVGSVVVARGLQTCRLSSCGARAQLLCGMWDLPRPGLEPVSPALADGFLTTAPRGKSLTYLKIFFIAVQLIYSAVLVSGVQQSESVIHIHVFTLFLGSFPIQVITEH